MQQRIDIYPTRIYKGYKCRPGRPSPFGATFVPGGVNFAVFSRYATSCTLVLFKKNDYEPLVEITIPEEYRIGNVFAIIVFDIDYENTEYGFRMDGPYDPRNGHRFDVSKVLLDPYARAISGRDEWGQQPDPEDIYPHRAFLAYDDFDWEDDRPLKIPIEDLIIYEMHVRGFTQHSSANVKHPGTFAAIQEKVAYFQELGVNCLELMPIFEFDEFEHSRISPVTGERLMNYWGYSTLGFFAPKAGYAATGCFGMQIDELKTLVKVLHQNGIEVCLDVVFNHTCEGGEGGPTLSYRGLDNKTYYMLTPTGHYFNFSGTGNTLNCNNPIVRDLVLNCLRYWVSEFHIDGFRFDLASILGRDQNGMPLPNPPLIEALAYDPILAKCKLIAEAWDAGGLYQVGSFPAYGRWAEWNGKYRDTIRRFLKGDAGQVWDVANCLQGSPDLYDGRGPTASINFVTSHDGFSLYDMMSYNHKHNEANDEDNRDGLNENYSWNCGVEGATDDPNINALRIRQMKNAIALLMVSQGVPMIRMGDEVAHTQWGNNNAYCQDNDLSWFDWTRLESHSEVFNFFKQCIAFRKAHPALRRNTYFTYEDVSGSGLEDITWHGTQAWRPDWTPYCRALAYLLSGDHDRTDDPRDEAIYVMMNMYWEGLWFELPQIDLTWHVFANTGAPHDVFEPGHEYKLRDQQAFLMGPRSVAILIGR